MQNMKLIRNTHKRHTYHIFYLPYFFFIYNLFKGVFKLQTLHIFMYCPCQRGKLTIFFFFYGDRSLNSKSCIFYALFKLIELSSRGR